VSDKDHKMTHELLGNVADRDCIITDHLIDSARTLEQRVKLLKKAGAGRCRHAHGPRDAQQSLD
jgi:phosphoribosylpyrophosphate synthetase